MCLVCVQLWLSVSSVYCGGVFRLRVVSLRSLLLCVCSLCCVVVIFYA